MPLKFNRNSIKDDNLKRINRQTICFNNHELAAINKFCNKYRINNKSKFMREAIITEVLKKFDEDYPSLFGEQNQLSIF